MIADTNFAKQNETALRVIIGGSQSVHAPLHVRGFKLLSSPLPTQSSSLSSSSLSSLLSSSLF